MACENPRPGWRAPDGGPLAFSKPKDKESYELIKIPCGVCILCRTDYARGWAVRITHEAQLWNENSFLTLTYSDDKLPEYSSLNYPDLQKFWKRLRKQIGKLSYYAVGEYGDNTQRPHYHACVFGHAFTEGRIILREQPTRLWTSPLLEQAWGLGHVSVGALNYQTAAYTASYVTKKLRAKQKYVRVDETTGELLELVQPRAFISLRPAISKRWLNTYGRQVYDHDRVVIQGKKQKPPKYYDQWLKNQSADFTVSPGGVIWRTGRNHKYEKMKDNRKRNRETETIEQTRARARNAHAHAKSKRKTV